MKRLEAIRSIGDKLKSRMSARKIRQSDPVDPFGILLDTAKRPLVDRPVLGFPVKHPLILLMIVLISVAAGVIVSAAGASAPKAEVVAFDAARMPDQLPGVSLNDQVGASGNASTTPDVGSSITEDSSNYPFVAALAGVIQPLGSRVQAEITEATADSSSHAASTSSANKPSFQAPELQPNKALIGTTILLDPGHGTAASPGVRGPTGLEEAVVVLDVSKRLRSLLENAGARVSMTRESSFSSLRNKQRAEMANKLAVSIFIRIHAETYESITTSGTEVLWAKEDSQILADLLAKELSKGTGMINLGANQVTGYEGLIASERPAVQVSIGALSNALNESFLRGEAEKQKVAESLYRGIVKYVHAR